MNECCRLQRVVLPLAAEVASRHLPQFTIHELEHLARGCLAPGRHSCLFSVTAGFSHLCRVIHRGLANTVSRRTAEWWRSSDADASSWHAQLPCNRVPDRSVSGTFT